MKELRKIFFERLDNFMENSYSISKELVNYRYGELYGLLESMLTINIMSFDEYISLVNEIDEKYNKICL